MGLWLIPFLEDYKKKEKSEKMDEPDVPLSREDTDKQDAADVNK